MVDELMGTKVYMPKDEEEVDVEQQVKEIRRLIKANNELLEDIENDMDLRKQLLDVKLRDLTPLEPKFGFEKDPEFVKVSGLILKKENETITKQWGKKKEEIFEQNERVEKELKRLLEKKARQARNKRTDYVG